MGKVNFVTTGFTFFSDSPFFFGTGTGGSYTLWHGTTAHNVLTKNRPKNRTIFWCKWSCVARKMNFISKFCRHFYRIIMRNKEWLKTKYFCNSVLELMNSFLICMYFAMCDWIQVSQPVEWDQLSVCFSRLKLTISQSYRSIASHRTITLWLMVELLVAVISCLMKLHSLRCEMMCKIKQKSKWFNGIFSII